MSDTKPKMSKYYQKVVKLEDAQELCKLLKKQTNKITRLLTGAHLPQQNGYIVIDALVTRSEAAGMRSLAKSVRSFTKDEKEMEG
jgi:hypothetical protein